MNIFSMVHLEQKNILYILFTSPAPWNKITLSDNLVLVILKDANKPANATEAVP